MTNRREAMTENLKEYIEQIMKIVMGYRSKNEEFENLPSDFQNMILTHALKLQENSTLGNINDTFNRKVFH